MVRALLIHAQARCCSLLLVGAAPQRLSPRAARARARAPLALSSPSPAARPGPALPCPAASHETRPMATLPSRTKQLLPHACPSNCSRECSRGAPAQPAPSFPRAPLGYRGMALHNVAERGTRQAGRQAPRPSVLSEGEDERVMTGTSVYLSRSTPTQAREPVVATDRSVAFSFDGGKYGWRRGKHESPSSTLA
jgi:hypothetical protein